MKMHRLVAGALVFCAISLPGLQALAGSVRNPAMFNHPGNLLTADQFNNRVIETDKNGNIVWSWGLGPTDFSANSILGVNDTERVGTDTLMAGTGIPAGVDPNCPAGCVDSRVILVDANGNIVWQYGQFGVNGFGPDQLSAPVQATYAPDKTVYITDQGNQRVIQVDQNLNILWQYGTTGVSGNGFDQLNNPNSAELLKNGDVLIADEGNNRVIEVDKATLNVVATYTAMGTMSGPAFASLLPNHQLLVTDSNNNRVITLDTGDNVLFQYFTNTQIGSNPNPLPTRAVAGRGQTFVISDQFNNRVIIVDKKGRLLKQYGNLNVIGYGTTNTQQGLYAPYDAKIIGDFKGLTRP
ncbi:MAG TPA: hypothetical protein VGI20_04680 [Rhizomicrobium sp.]|jgi:hypothetical protein